MIGSGILRKTDTLEMRKASGPGMSVTIDRRSGLRDFSIDRRSRSIPDYRERSDENPANIYTVCAGLASIRATRPAARRYTVGRLLRDRLKKS
jgi:hypothetical protein